MANLMPSNSVFLQELLKNLFFGRGRERERNRLKLRVKMCLPNLNILNEWEKAIAGKNITRILQLY